jgi:hypothetical protein
MIPLLEFISRISIVLYALAVVGVVFALRGWLQGRRHRRVAVFGLEREEATQQTQSSSSALIALLLLIGSIYVIDNIVMPNLGEIAEIQPTPTSVVFITPQATATDALLLYPTITPTVGIPPAEVTDSAPDTEGTSVDGCEILGARVTEPASGDVVGGQVEVRGEANILNFGQYKFEISGPSTNGSWVVVGTYREAIPAGLLGVWDSTSLIPGDYTFRLVVMREDGTYLTPCEVPISISGGVQPTPQPDA